MAFAVYSGKVRLCAVGVPVQATDYADKPLFTGDIVCIDTPSSHSRPTLTVVVADGDGPFVMGIKSVPMDAPGEWNIWKLKDHRDVVDGEHWKAWGFNFKAEIDPFDDETHDLEAAEDNGELL
jgi:hypothetical protein